MVYVILVSSNMLKKVKLNVQLNVNTSYGQERRTAKTCQKEALQKRFSYWYVHSAYLSKLVNTAYKMNDLRQRKTQEVASQNRTRQSIFFFVTKNNY